MRRIGVLGGTFDPPHLGHLMIAEIVRETLNLEEVWFMPAGEPPHKKQAMIDGQDRLHMLEHAIKDSPYFKSIDIELKRTGKSYTFDTMCTLTNEHPNIEFYFIIGADMVEYLPHWHRIEELSTFVKFVGVKRAGFQLESPYPVITVDIPMIDISSTLIRERLKNNLTVKYLVPDAVYTYIRENGLYENR